ncbi:MAG: vitamin B12 dependent-methionine synthase activation domain-containing protein, partial [Alphaproteobacteria bacterium]
QPIEHILAAAKEHQADAVGMSGLLVKSTVIMRENLIEMTREGLSLPVILGGAALTRGYVEADCVKAYGAGKVAYARDAFDGLELMDKVMTGRFDEHLSERAKLQEGKPERRKDRRLEALERPVEKARPVELEEIRLRRAELGKGLAVPTPPFFGPRMIDKVPIRNLLPFLNEAMLFQFHWGFKKAGKSREEFAEWAKREVRPIMVKLAKQCADENIIVPKAAYGYWKAAGEGNDLVLFDENGTAEVARFTLPRQNREDGLCIADFVRDISDPERDVIGLQDVTAGARASEVAAEWFKENRYQDYLYLHGFSVEIAEAMAEYVHKRIRNELGFGNEDERDINKLLKQGYRGSRYSFGYPACPNLGDQRRLLELLGAERVGVVMGEEDQLEPEQSTSAIVILHPQAKYFTV